jgi:PAS domain S-box-containing protein
MSDPKASLIVLDRKPPVIERRKENLNHRFSPVPGNDFAFLANAIPQLVWSSTPSGACDYFNQRWFDYTGTTFEQSAGLGWQFVIHPDDLESTEAAWHEAHLNGQEWVVEHRIRHRDGEYRWNLTKAIPMRSVDGSIYRWFGTSTDVHAQKIAMSDQREQAKRRARAKLSKHLAHEINNPLNATMNLLYLAQVFPEQAQSFVEQAEEQVRKIAKLTAGILKK